VICRREILVAILIYVALDLSLPAMPGAFVFEAADSVESIGGGRMATRAVVFPAPAPSPVSPMPQLCAAPPHRRVAGEVREFGAPRTRRLPGAAGDPSEPSEDPH
jgi:hypothetical protein